MDTTKYRIFLHALDLGSFSAAAESLGYTPSGISHIVDAVETEMGITMVNRGRNGITVTSGGKQIVDDIRRVIEQENILKQRVSDLTGLLSGNVRIGAYYSIASHWLPKIISIFQNDYPKVSIDIREGGHDQLKNLINSSKVDFCLTSYDRESANKWIPLRDDRMVIVVPDGHELLNKEKVTIDDCSRYPFIMPALGKDYDIVNLLEEADTRMNIKYSTIENYSAIAMVEQGLGISMMNELITKGLDRRVKLIDLYPPKHISLGISIESMRTASPAAKKMIEYIKTVTAKI